MALLCATEWEKSSHVDLCLGQLRDMAVSGQAVHCSGNGEECPAGETQYVATAAGQKSATTIHCTVMDLTLYCSFSHCNSNGLDE